MKGHIRERSPGRWAIILDVRDPETGSEAQVAFVPRHKREAQIECAADQRDGRRNHVEPSAKRSPSSSIVG